MVVTLVNVSIPLSTTSESGIQLRTRPAARPPISPDSEKGPTWHDLLLSILTECYRRSLVRMLQGEDITGISPNGAIGYSAALFKQCPCASANGMRLLRAPNFSSGGKRWTESLHA
jgi:hypothetical protein